MNRHVRARMLLGLSCSTLALAACNALTEVGKFKVDPNPSPTASDTALPPAPPKPVKDAGPATPPPDVDKNNGPKLHVFVTSDKTIGSFSKLAGGDEFCRNLAEQAGHPANWTAWLSTGDTLADARLDPEVNGPWYLFGGDRLAVASRAELQSGKITSPIDIDEQGNKVVPEDDDPNVWTGTSATGGRVGGDCSQWDLQYCIDGVCPYGGAGRSDQSDANWTAAGQVHCFEHYLRLYCFENPTPP